MFTYTLNALILNEFIKMYDVGGSVFGNAFGTYFGMGISFVVSRFRAPVTQVKSSYNSSLFAFLGCFIIFCYAPSLNSQYLTNTPF